MFFSFRLPQNIPGRSEFVNSLFSASNAVEQRDAIVRFENSYQDSVHLL